MKIDPATLSMIVQFATLLAILCGGVRLFTILELGFKTLRTDFDKHCNEDKEQFGKIDAAFEARATATAIDLANLAVMHHRLSTLERASENHRPPSPPMQ